MKRYFDPSIFKKFIYNFVFLFDAIKNSGGELDLRLRNNYFNLYYKGNSLAKVTPLMTGEYEVVIHQKFLKSEKIDNFLRADERLPEPQEMNNYASFILSSKLLRPFFSQRNLSRLCGNISRVGYSEEMAFEQMLITDNLERDEIFIIDRQITETALKGKRADLLALKQIRRERYHFWVIEVKLGKNPELKGEVGAQLGSYVAHINKHFDDWKNCYERVYCQMKETGIFKKPGYQRIKIEKPVQGTVIVGGYSGIANKSIDALRKNCPELDIKRCHHLL